MEQKIDFIQEVYIVRHAQSTYNQAVSDKNYEGDYEADINLLDAQLTDLG